MTRLTIVTDGCKMAWSRLAHATLKLRITLWYADSVAHECPPSCCFLSSRIRLGTLKPAPSISMLSKLCAWPSRDQGGGLRWWPIWSLGLNLWSWKFWRSWGWGTTAKAEAAAVDIMTTSKAADEEIQLKQRQQLLTLRLPAKLRMKKYS